MKNKNRLILICIVALLVITGVFIGYKKLILPSFSHSNSEPTTAISVQFVNSAITADGSVTAQNQETLTFLNSGRVAYIGFKEGDRVQQGQIITSLDTTIASHNVTAAESQYESAKAALDKVLDDIHLSQYGNGGFANVGSANETQTQKTQRQQAEAAANVAYDNLQNAKKQLELSTITAPFNGTILSIQNISEGINVSPASGSSITLVGGGELKFVANAMEQDIDSVHVGQPVTIKLDTKKNLNPISGTVEKIAQGKTTLPDGRNVIKIDIQSSNLQSQAQAGQTGTIEISIGQAGTIVVPSWTVLGNKYIWVIANGQAVLKEVKIGTTVDSKTSITSGLSPNDQVILSPQIIAKDKYKLL